MTEGKLHHLDGVCVCVGGCMCVCVYVCVGVGVKMISIMHIQKGANI